MLLLTLGITRIIEQESLDLTIWGSANGDTWTQIAAFPQKFYCGTYSLLVDLTTAPGGYRNSGAMENGAVGQRRSDTALSGFTCLRRTRTSLRRRAFGSRIAGPIANRPQDSILPYIYGATHRGRSITVLWDAETVTLGAWASSKTSSSGWV